MSTTRNSNAENLQADILVIGGGGAGLTAAIAAAEAGAKNIIVLEKAPSLGGNAGISHGIFAVESPAQKRLGIKISGDEVFKEKMESANWRVDPRLVRVIINKSGDIIRWLEEEGLKFNSILEFVVEGEGPKVFHMLGAGASGAVGHGLAETLIKGCQDRGVQLLCETAARKILIDEKGEVNGVLATTKDKELKITAKSVIIATGGFGENKEMINKYFPSHGDIFCNSLPQMTGDGILMAAEAGAVIGDQLAILLIGPQHYQGAGSLDILVRRPEVILVNKNGERYVDESLGLHHMDMASNCLSRQPGKICYALIDSKVKRDMIQKREVLSGIEGQKGNNGAWMDELENDFQSDAAEGTAKVADSWEEIAEWMGAKPEALRATVEQYSSFCDKGYDADFLKEERYLLPLRTPPYYAVLGRQGCDTTVGGIKINHRMEVINKQDSLISGLYAVGDNASGWEFIDYSFRSAGAALCFALCSGYIAGENAAKYVLGNK